METQKRNARIAGLWYLAMAVSGLIGLVYAPSKILVDGDAAATATNLGAHRVLLRLGVLGGLGIYGDRLAWIVGSKLALTEDQGRSWTVQDLPPDSDHGQVRAKLRP